MSPTSLQASTTARTDQRALLGTARHGWAPRGERDVSVLNRVVRADRLSVAGDGRSVREARGAGTGQLDSRESSRLTYARLYYQLTATLQTFLTIPSSAPYQIELYNHFVESFASKLNQLRLVEIGVAVGRQYSGTFLLLL